LVVTRHFQLEHLQTAAAAVAVIQLLFSCGVVVVSCQSPLVIA